MIDKQIYLISSTKTLSYHSLLKAHKLGNYLVSTGPTKVWSAGISLLHQCFLHFPHRSSAVACFIHLYGLYDLNVSSSLWHGVQAAVNRSHQPHCFYSRSQHNLHRWWKIGDDNCRSAGIALIVFNYEEQDDLKWPKFAPGPPLLICRLWHGQKFDLLLTKIAFININGEACSLQFPKHLIQVSDVFFIGVWIHNDIHLAENISCRIVSENKLQSPDKTGQRITETQRNSRELVRLIFKLKRCPYSWRFL